MLVFSVNASAEKELLSDKARIKFSRVNIQTLQDGSVLATYQAGFEGKNRLLSKIKDIAMGLPSLLGLGSKEEEEEKPPVKKMDNGKIAMYAILGLGGLAILAIAFSKGMPQKSDK